VSGDGAASIHVTASFWCVFVGGADGAGAVGTAVEVSEGGGTSFVVLAGGRGSVDALGAGISAMVALYLLGAPQARKVSRSQRLARGAVHTSVPQPSSHCEVVPRTRASIVCAPSNKEYSTVYSFNIPIF